jgi:hypothetical protein
MRAVVVKKRSGGTPNHSTKRRNFSRSGVRPCSTRASVAEVAPLVEKQLDPVSRTGRSCSVANTTDSVVPACVDGTHISILGEGSARMISLAVRSLGRDALELDFAFKSGCSTV